MPASSAFKGITELDAAEQGQTGDVTFSNAEVSVRDGTADDLSVPGKGENLDTAADLQERVEFRDSLPSAQMEAMLTLLRSRKETAYSVAVSVPGPVPETRGNIEASTAKPPPPPSVPAPGSPQGKDTEKIKKHKKNKKMMEALLGSASQGPSQEVKVKEDDVEPPKEAVVSVGPTIGDPSHSESTDKNQPVASPAPSSPVKASGGKAEKRKARKEREAQKQKDASLAGGTGVPDESKAIQSENPRDVREKLSRRPSLSDSWTADVAANKRLSEQRAALMSSSLITTTCGQMRPIHCGHRFHPDTEQMVPLNPRVLRMTRYVRNSSLSAGGEDLSFCPEAATSLTACAYGLAALDCGDMVTAGKIFVSDPPSARRMYFDAYHCRAGSKQHRDNWFRVWVGAYECLGVKSAEDFLDGEMVEGKGAEIVQILMMNCHGSGEGVGIPLTRMQEVVKKQYAAAALMAIYKQGIDAVWGKCTELGFYVYETEARSRALSYCHDYLKEYRSEWDQSMPMTMTKFYGTHEKENHHLCLKDVLALFHTMMQRYPPVTRKDQKITVMCTDTWPYYHELSAWEVDVLVVNSVRGVFLCPQFLVTLPWPIQALVQAVTMRMVIATGDKEKLGLARQLLSIAQDPKSWTEAVMSNGGEALIESIICRAPDHTSAAIHLSEVHHSFLHESGSAGFDPNRVRVRMSVTEKIHIPGGVSHRHHVKSDSVLLGSGLPGNIVLATRSARELQERMEKAGQSVGSWNQRGVPLIEPCMRGGPERSPFLFDLDNPCLPLAFPMRQLQTNHLHFCHGDIGEMPARRNSTAVSAPEIMEGIEGEPHYRSRVRAEIMSLLGCARDTIGSVSTVTPCEDPVSGTSVQDSAAPLWDRLMSVGDVQIPATRGHDEIRLLSERTLEGGGSIRGSLPATQSQTAVSPPLRPMPNPKLPQHTPDFPPGPKEIEAELMVESTPGEHVPDELEGCRSGGLPAPETENDSQRLLRLLKNPAQLSEDKAPSFVITDETRPDQEPHTSAGVPLRDDPTVPRKVTHVLVKNTAAQARKDTQRSQALEYTIGNSPELQTRDRRPSAGTSWLLEGFGESKATTLGALDQVCNVGDQDAHGSIENVRLASHQSAGAGNMTALDQDSRITVEMDDWLGKRIDGPKPETHDVHRTLSIFDSSKRSPFPTVASRGLEGITTDTNAMTAIASRLDMVEGVLRTIPQQVTDIVSSSQQQAASSHVDDTNMSDIKAMLQIISNKLDGVSVGQSSLEARVRNLEATVEQVKVSVQAESTKGISTSAGVAVDIEGMKDMLSDNLWVSKTLISRMSVLEGVTKNIRGLSSSVEKAGEINAGLSASIVTAWGSLKAELEKTGLSEVKHVIPPVMPKTSVFKTPVATPLSRHVPPPPPVPGSSGVDRNDPGVSSSSVHAHGPAPPPRVPPPPPTTQRDPDLSDQGSIRVKKEKKEKKEKKDKKDKFGSLVAAQMLTKSHGNMYGSEGFDFSL